MAIGYDVILHQGGPSETEKAEAERTTPQREQGAAATREGVAYDHDHNLADLQAQVGPLGESRCYGHHRRQLRNAILRYVDSRAQAVKFAATDPLLHGLDRLYQTPDDAQAMSDARYMLTTGVLLASDFSTWTTRENAVFPLPLGVASQCTRPMEEAEKDAHP